MNTSIMGPFPREARALRRNPLIAAVMIGVASVVAAQTPTTYEIVHAFRNPGNWCPVDEKQNSRLIHAADGYFYGTTCGGGINGLGTIYRVDSSGNLTTVHSFGYADGANPLAGLIQAIDGNFYGTSSRGGASNLGVVFKMDAAGRVTRLHSFVGNDGQNPYAALLQASDGNFYGSTRSGGDHSEGTIFRIDSSGNFTTLLSFDRYVSGAIPIAELIQGADGRLYGSASWGGGNDEGCLFSMDPAGNLTVLHNFNFGDGSRPYAALVQAADGDFYGATLGGGASNRGTIFRVDSSGGFSSLHSFNVSDGAYPYSALIQGPDGSLYGTTSRGDGTSSWGTVFKINAAGNLSTLHNFGGADGVHPRASLVEGPDGVLYGATDADDIGPEGFVPGSIFKMSLSGEVTTLRTLGGTDGRSPTSLIQAADGDFYGTTVSGGKNDRGSIFSFHPGSVLTLLHSFAGPDGANPGSLIQAGDGTFYGTSGGAAETRYGTIFRMDSAGLVTTLHVLAATEGWGLSPLLLANDGNFYGSTLFSTVSGGAIFRIKPSGEFSILWNFTSPIESGANPNGLVQVSGQFFGTTQSGGFAGKGTIFRMAMEGTVETEYHLGAGQDDGRLPGSALLSSNELFGTTEFGGSEDAGTIFKIAPGSQTLDTLHSFNGTDGAQPRAALVKAADGNIYGTTEAGGSSDAGTIFKTDSSGSFTTVHEFNGLDGMYPIAELVPAADGYLYGTARGGALGDGIIFRLTNSGAAVNEVTPSSGSAFGSEPLDVLGGGFVPGAMVTVGDAPGNDVAVLDSTFLYLFTPVLSPGTLNDVTVTNPGSVPATATRPNAFFADFLDMPQTDPFHDFVEKIFRAGITAGCGGGSYCTDSAVTRAQMAVFLLKAEHGSSFVPPPCNSFFADVACPSMFADWIEQLAAEGITAGCGGGNYCPSTPVTRAQMAVFLLKAEHGTGYAPPGCTAIFGDVSCPSLFADWIEQLSAEGITSGCGGGNYCPGNPNTRGQMAVFLTKTFHL